MKHFLYVIIMFSSFFSCISCQKPNDSILKQGLISDLPVRYRDSSFANVDSTSYKDLVYRVTGNFDITETLMLDVYMPLGDTSQNRAAIIFLHGGGWIRNSIEFNRKDPDIKYLCDKLAKRGYVVISPSYRTGFEFGPNMSITDSVNNYYEAMYRASQDIRSLVRFVKLNSLIGRIDSTRIFIGGESAGSITALNATFLDEEEVPNTFKNKWGTLDGSGAYDYPGHSNHVKGIINVEGNILDTAFIDTDDNMILSFYGDIDPFYNKNIVEVAITPTKKLSISYFNGLDIQQRSNNLNLNNPPIRVFENSVHGDTFNNPNNKLIAINSMCSWMYAIMQ